MVASELITLTSFSLLTTLSKLVLLFIGHFILLAVFARKESELAFPELYPGPFYSYLTSEPSLRRLWVAVESNGKVVGTIGVKRISDQTAELVRLSVSKDVRRQGIGSRLIGYVVNYCKSQGYKKLELNTLDDFHEAKLLYQREGFHFVKLFLEKIFFFEILQVNMIKNL